VISLDANNPTELFEKLREINRRVPLRGKGRTKESLERWTIINCLTTLAKNDRLSYPLMLKKGEHPDFLLVMDKENIGIEVTEAVNQDFARATTLPEYQENKIATDPSLFKWGSPPKTHTELVDILTRSKFTGPGWTGSEVEEEFAQAIYDIILFKTKKLQGEHFKRHGSDWLSVYLNLHLPALENDEACSLLSEKITDYWFSDGFDKILVLDDAYLFVFTNNGFEILENQIL